MKITEIKTFYSYLYLENFPTSSAGWSLSISGRGFGFLISRLKQRFSVSFTEKYKLGKPWIWNKIIFFFKPVFINKFIAENFHPDHGHEAEPHHQTNSHHDPKLEQRLDSLLSWNIMSNS